MKKSCCAVCGKIFKQVGNHIEKHHISIKEYYDAFMKKEGDGLCKHCGQPTKFTADLSKAYSDYCSNSCSALGTGKGKWMLGKKASKETKKKISKATKGKTYEEIYGKERAAKERLSRTISNRVRWEGKKKNDIRPHQNCDYKYTEWRTAVFKRDHFQCKKCHRKGYLEAHHKKPWATYPELRYIITNGMTLCRRCHKKIHKTIYIKRQKYEEEK